MGARTKATVPQNLGSDLLRAGGAVVLSIIDGKAIDEDGRITIVYEEKLLESAQRVTEQASAELKRRKTFQHRMTLEGKY